MLRMVTLDITASKNLVPVMVVYFFHRCREAAMCTVSEYLVYKFFLCSHFSFKGQRQTTEGVQGEESKGKLKEMNEYVGGELGESWFLS